MMRGVSTWAVAVREPDGRDRGQLRAARLVGEAPPGPAPARDPRRRRPRRVAEDRLPGARDLGQRAARRGRGRRQGGDRRLDVGADDRALDGARGRPLLRRPGRRHQPDQGLARLGAGCSGWSRGSCGPRSSSATSSRSAACPTCDGCSSTTAPSTRRSPATRRATSWCPSAPSVYSRLHPRCGTSFLLIVMVLAIFVFAPIGLPEWYWLVALADPRHPADRRPLLRGDQVGRAQPAQALGAGADVARADAPEPDHARARPRPARGRDRLARGGARGRESRRGLPATPTRSRSSPDPSPGGSLNPVIEKLVEQIEERFAELERQMSDPEVIADRERYAEVGREYRELEPAHELAAASGGALRGDLEGARGAARRGRRGRGAAASWSPRRPSACTSSRRRSAWRWSSATPTTTRT